jgi:hypothetical protein
MTGRLCSYAAIFSGGDFCAEVFVQQTVSFGFRLCRIMHFMHGMQPGG